jgi:hypothetical protein
MNRKYYPAIIYAVIVLPIVIIILVMNFNFVLINSMKTTQSPEAAIPQIKHLKTKMHSGTDEAMQRIFPEGYLFMNALYGLSCAEVGSMTSLPDSVRYDWLEEGKWALDNIESPKGTEAFQTASTICPEFGIFYCGWSNYLRAKLFSVQPVNGVVDSATLASACTGIAECYSRSATPFLQTYSSASWPADNFPAIASLAIYDRVLTPRFEELILTWLNSVDTHLDPQTGLIPHSVQSYTGKTDEGTRGCSQALIIRLLFEIDSARACMYYNNFHRQFVTTFLGMPAIREYPKGCAGQGDIDSGPVLFGIGSAATIVGLGTARMAGDTLLANGLSGFIESVGLPVTYQGRKIYGFGLMPIADAFLCWSKSCGIRNGNSLTEEQTYSGFLFHVVCTAFCVALLLPFVVVLKRK